MAKITMPSVASGFTLSTVNSNFQAIAAELNNKVLYRNPAGGEPNQMYTTLDMNSQRILNLPEPISDLEPLRKKDAGRVFEISNEVLTARDQAVQAAIDSGVSAGVSANSAAASNVSAIASEDSKEAAAQYAQDAYNNSRLAVGTVTTGAPGSSVSVVINGVPGAQTISFTIPQGLAGNDGDDGREVEFQKSATHIQWRYVGDVAWNNLVALVDITGPAGPSTDVAAVTHAATGKTPPVDADEIPVADSAASFVLKKITWASIKAATLSWAVSQANTWAARQTFKDVVETTFTITDGASVNLNPANGSIQVWTLGANRTPTATNFLAGQGITLMVDDGAAYTITWSTIGVTWLTSDGNAPTLKTTGYTPIVLWKVGSTIYGK